MSDKSFGDHFGKSVVKNPLLSSAITGLSLDDLSHAVLLPAESLQPVSSSSERSVTETQTAHQDISSGDNTSQPAKYPSPHVNKTDYNTLERHNASTHSVSQKSDDDFDVSVYFARLQGTKYISAPLNIGLAKDGAIDTAEENLEEINLNEPEKPPEQQSITSDIAQNFSQLPNVLPQVASAVFSSFSNMLSLKSREQTPDEARSGWGESVHRLEIPAVPMKTVEEDVPKNMAPPPREPPIGGIGNFRITTKKKYAQIPGLMSGDTYATNFAMPPQPQTGQHLFDPTIGQPSTNTQYFTPDTTVTDPYTETVTKNIEPHTHFSVDLKNDAVNAQQTGNVPTYSLDERLTFDIIEPDPTQSSTPVIPPPPMFTNVKKDTPVTKSVLPPSVARRISSNHPIIKPQAITPSTITNIFVPTLQDDGQTFDQTHLKLLDPIGTSSTPESLEAVPGPLYDSTNASVMFGGQESRSIPMFSCSNTESSTNVTGPESHFKDQSSTIITPPQQNVWDTIRQPPILNLSHQPDLISSVTTQPSVTIPSAIQMFDTQTMKPEIGVTSISQNYSVQNTSAFITSSSIPNESTSPQVPFFNKPVEQITKLPENPPTAPLQEPPKALGNVSFRLNKKRPQYYSGPVEGVGAISNNVKPVIAPVDTGSFSGAFFTPTLQPDPNMTSEPQPFDISAPVNPVPFDITQSQQPQVQPEFNTSFDLSRQTNEVYEPTKESPGFGIIGSLKSKLSSIDINKIQNTVTTFFDPAYNSEITETPQTSQDQSQIYTQHQQSNFEICVPAMEATPQLTHNYSTYNHPSQYHQNPYSYYHSEGQHFQQNQTQLIYASSTPHIDTNVSGDTNNQATITPLYQNIITPISNVTTEPSYVSPFTNLADPTIRPPIVETQKENLDINQNTEILKQDVKDKTQEMETTQFYNPLQFSDYSKEYPSHPEEPKKAIGQKSDTSSIAEKVYPSSNAKDFFDMPQPSEIFSPQSNEIFSPESFSNKFESLGIDENLPTTASIFGGAAVGSTEPAPIGFKLGHSTFEPKKEIFQDHAKNETIGLDSLTKPIDRIIDDTLNDSEKEDITLRETSLVESLSADHIPIVGVSTVPLFGLSTIIADKPKEGNETKKIIFEVPKTEVLDLNNMSLFENFLPVKKIVKEEDEIESKSELSICETCREVTKPGKEHCKENVTNKLIENLTSPIQLSNAVEVPLKETDFTDEMENFDTTQGAEIPISTEITETLHDPLEEVKEPEMREFGWTNTTGFTNQPVDHDYTFKLDPNSVGFFGSNSLFFDKVPSVSGDLKNEFEKAKDIVIPRQIEPTAPPAEEDKSSESTGGLDVHSIEQDANKDFPIYEDFLIEASGSSNIEYKKKEESKDATPVTETFTDRIEKFKKMEEVLEHDDIFDSTSLFTLPPKTSPAITIASYFDTGNYAAETHYRNSYGSPPAAGYPVSTTMRIPPGFEDEFRRRLSSGSFHDKVVTDKDIGPLIPDTTTQTSITCTSTYTAAREVSPDLNFRIEASIAEIVEEVLTTREPTEAPYCITTFAGNTEEKVEKAAKSSDVTVPQQEIPRTESLPDPMNFFSSPEVSRDEPETFNRLASYFTSPPQRDPTKSFFELSQSQNHYRHANGNSNSFILDKNLNNTIDQENRIATLDLIKDLTSPRNIENVQIVRTVNYFTIEYDDPSIKNAKRDVNQNKLKSEETEDNAYCHNVKICEYCCDFNTKVYNINDADYTVREYANESTVPGSCDVKMDSVNAVNKNVTINFGGIADDAANDGVSVVTENRTHAEYNPVKHHWFYRVEIEDKSIWRGFSEVDSRALEEAFTRPDLNENTLVPTDGGRYDVNLVKRIRTAVYWNDTPTNVRRCSWFYKGTTDARYVPYSEAVAERLENEYFHAVTTGEWHRKLLLPNNEMVVMHGPSVMVHFLHSGSTDGFSAPPQSAAIPRVVRRGHDESEIEDAEPSSIDHLLLLCHGVGSACDMRFRSVEEVVDDFRATSLQLVQSHYRNSFDNGAVSRIEVLPISWHSSLHSGESGVDKRLAQVTLDSIPKLRSFTNDTVLDVLFYTSPVYCQTIIDTVCRELNRIYELFKKRNPLFKGDVSLGGHSLGSVILYDLLCNQKIKKSKSTEKSYVVGSAGTGQSSVRYPSLDFHPTALYALGSPIAIFECIRGVETLGKEFSLPTCKKFYNIFHPYDPIAYRIEPLINPALKNVKPYLIPHHKGRKRMHLELKDTMARVGADLKQKLIDSLKTTWNKWKPQPAEGHLEKVVEEENELCSEKDDTVMDEATPDMLGKLNEGHRIDYVLQEAPLEVINEYLFAMTSHVGYWESEDTMLMMLREIYSSLGVQPDGSVPQRGLTVHRTRTGDMQDGVMVYENPTTSHDT